jgi:hypothetical protein
MLFVVHFCDCDMTNCSMYKATLDSKHSCTMFEGLQIFLYPHFIIQTEIHLQVTSLWKEILSLLFYLLRKYICLIQLGWNLPMILVIFTLLLLSHLLKFTLQIYCRQVLLDAARKVGIEGVDALLEDPSKGVAKVWFPVIFVPETILFQLKTSCIILAAKRFGKTSTSTHLAFRGFHTLWYEGYFNDTV